MSAAIKVGLFTLLCLVVFGYLVLKTEDYNLFAPKGQRYAAVFDTVAGLDDKSAVRIAGVRIGRVDGIGLEGQKARVNLLLDGNVELPAGSVAAIRNMGLLGDKYIEIELGPAGGPRLPVGTVLPGTTPPGFDQAMAKLDKVAGSIEKFTDSLASNDSGNRLAEMFDNLAVLTRDLRDMVADNRAGVSSTIGNVEQVSATLARELPRLVQQLQRTLDQVEATVAENRGNLKDSLGNVKELTSRVQTSIDNLNVITDRLVKGEGSIGKLLTSDDAHDSLVKTLDSVEAGVTKLSDTLGRAEKLHLDLGVEGVYLSEVEQSRSAFSLRLDPGTGNHRFYQLAAVSDPRGRIQTKTDVITTTQPDGSVETQTIRKVTTEDRITLSAQFGFELGDRAQLRAGLFESSGGAAIDYGLLNKRLWLTLEAYDFSRPGLDGAKDLDPHLRFLGRYNLNQNLYVVGGYDDFLVDDNRSVFLGGGVTGGDDDLKYLMGSLPLGSLK